MVRVPAFSAILLISGLTGVTLMTAQANDQLAPPQTAVERRAERTIVCNRLRCWAIREGCRFVARATLLRDNRIRCGPARPA